MVIIDDKIRYYNVPYSHFVDNLDAATVSSTSKFDDIVILKETYEKIKARIRTDYQNISDKILPYLVKNIPASKLKEAGIKRALKLSKGVTPIYGEPWTRILNAIPCKYKSYQGNNGEALALVYTGSEGTDYYRISKCKLSDIEEFIKWAQDPSPIFTSDQLLQKISDQSHNTTEEDISAIIDLLSSNNESNKSIGYSLLAQLDRVKYHNLIYLLLYMFPTISTGMSVEVKSMLNTIRRINNIDSITSISNMIVHFNEYEQACGLRVVEEYVNRNLDNIMFKLKDSVDSIKFSVVRNDDGTDNHV